MKLGSFGRGFAARSNGMGPAEARGLLASGVVDAEMLLGYGNGRTYGDSCLNHAGRLVDMRSAATILSFDPATGLLEAEAGAFLGDVIAHAAPHGWFPAVVPGTQWVTIGGAIANDVHGKNHHRRGTFGVHVDGLRLMRSDGKVYECSEDRHAELFRATIGGMGLTGLILSATIRLMRVGSVEIEQRVQPFPDLQTFFSMVEQADHENEYAVAWIDQLAGGARAGRGLLITGNHARWGARVYGARPSRLAVPVQPPVSVLNRPFLALFNRAYRWANTRHAGGQVTGARGFFFPLDGVANWNRLYGPRGLHQHQSVIPDDNAREAVPALLAEARERGQGSFLTVLKRFGAVRSPAILSFPRPGYTLTLDFPDRGARTLELLAELDRITLAAGGAINPYKDARMTADTFAASFPQWDRLEALRDPAFMSDFWRRTAMQLPRAAMDLAAE